MLRKVLHFIRLKISTAYIEVRKKHCASYGVHLHIARNES